MELGDDRGLRFAILCDGTTFEAWQARCIQGLLQEPGVVAAALILPADPGRSRIHRRHERPALYKAYTALRPSHAQRPVDLASRLGSLRVVRCRVRADGDSPQDLLDPDLNEIRQMRLDFLLGFSFENARGGILTAARYGMWSFHHDEEAESGGSLPGFWEIYDGEPVTGATLQRMTDRPDRGVVLRQGWFPTRRESYRVNLDTVLFGSAGWPAAVCRDIRAGNASYLDAPPVMASAPPLRPLDNGRMVRFLGVEFRHLAGRIRTEILKQAQWTVGVVHGPIQDFLEEGHRPDVRWLSPPRGTFFADPFGHVQDGTLWVLGEVYDYRTGKGTLAAIPVPEQGAQGAPVPILPQEVHASYPFILQHNGAVYCVPETFGAREVRLYRATEFPRRWEHVSTLLRDVGAVDSTLFQHEGRWWLACADMDIDPFVHLYLFHADRLEGPYRAHERNPVKADARSSRPGGTPFVQDGRLYRPAQDCSRTYGGRLVINRVTRLSPREFAEEPATTVEPLATGPYREGLHTLSAAGEFTLLDSKRYVGMPGGLRNALSRAFEMVGGGG